MCVKYRAWGRGGEGVGWVGTEAAVEAEWGCKGLTSHVSSLIFSHILKVSKHSFMCRGH